MNSKKGYLAVAAVALLALAGCGSVGDVLGTNGSSSNSNSNFIHGTVDSVDTYGHSILLTNTSGGYNTMLSGTSGSSVRVYYDNNTNVQYQNQNYRPEDLERGDQVDVRVNESGNRLVADQMTVTYNAATASSSYPNSNYPNNGTSVTTISGTVRSVDTSRRQIELDRGYGNTVWVDYNSNTPVSYNGRSYYPSDLERGDQVDIRVTDMGGGRYTASSVSVLRSVNGVGNSSSSSSSYNSTIRGTVQYVDTSNRTIQLNQTSWISGFNGNTNGSTITVQYDTNAGVYVNGALQPVSGLERGDVVEVQVNGSNAGSLFANRITLVRDVRQ